MCLLRLIWHFYNNLECWGLEQIFSHWSKLTFFTSKSLVYCIFVFHIYCTFMKKDVMSQKKKITTTKNMILLWPYLVSNVTGLNWKRLSHFKKNDSYKANLLFSYSFASNVQKVKNSQNDRFATVWVEFSVALVFSPQVTHWSPCLRDFQNWKSYFVTGDKDEEKCDL